MTRLAIQPFTFSNGVRLLKGAIIDCALAGIHHDEENYTDPDIFNPWRFSSLRSTDSECMKHQLVTTSNEFLIFGHGRHAWSAHYRVIYSALTHRSPH